MPSGVQGPLVARAVVGAARPVGGYDVLSLSVPASPAWARVRPGQFLVLPGDPRRGEVRPRVEWVAGVDVDPLHGTTVELVVPASSADLAVGGEVRVLGPFGRGFPLPARPVPVLVVAHEAAAAPVRWLVTQLRERGCAVHVLLSAGDPDGHLDPGSLRRLADSVVLTSPDGLPEALLARLQDPACDPALVLATGPLDLVRVVAEHSGTRVVRVVALDPHAAGRPVCGTGVCGLCDLRVAGPEGARTVRPCLEGPVVPGEWLLPTRPEVRRASR